jgi:hypothetical protein
LTGSDCSDGSSGPGNPAENAAPNSSPA